MQAGVSEIGPSVSPPMPSLTARSVAPVAQAPLASILDALLPQLPVGVIVAGPTGAIMYSNELGRRILADASTHDRAEWALARSLLMGETVRDDRMEIASAGARRWLDVSATPIRSAANRIDGAVVTFVDVTAERNAAAWRPAIESLQRL